MIQLWVFYGVLFFAYSSTASTDKPFVLWPNANIKADNAVKASQSCFLRQHLPKHIEFVLEKILPRIERESKVFLNQQVFGDKSFYVADELNYRDLYHAHLRYPGIREMTSLSDYYDSKNYHLQYHSFEHLDKMKLAWMQELDVLLTDPHHKEWVKQRIQNALQTSSGEFASSVGGLTEKPLLILEDRELLQIAQRWHVSLGARSQGVQRLMLKLKTMNGLVSGVDAIYELMYFRSIASFDDVYGVINPGLDIIDHWQPLDLFFEAKSRQPKMAELIRAYKKRTGLNWVGNPTSRDGESLGISKAIKEDTQLTFNKLIALAEADPRAEAVFKNTADLPKFVTLFALSGDMIFQFRYNISTYCTEAHSKFGY